MGFETLKMPLLASKDEDKIEKEIPEEEIITAKEEELSKEEIKAVKEAFEIIEDKTAPETKLDSEAIIKEEMGLFEKLRGKAKTIASAMVLITALSIIPQPAQAGVSSWIKEKAQTVESFVKGKTEKTIEKTEEQKKREERSRMEIGGEWYKSAREGQQKPEWAQENNFFEDGEKIYSVGCCKADKETSGEIGAEVIASQNILEQAKLKVLKSLSEEGENTKEFDIIMAPFFEKVGINLIGVITNERYTEKVIKKVDENADSISYKQSGYRVFALVQQSKELFDFTCKLIEDRFRKELETQTKTAKEQIQKQGEKKFEDREIGEEWVDEDNKPIPAWLNKGGFFEDEKYVYFVVSSGPVSAEEIKHAKEKVVFKGRINVVEQARLKLEKEIKQAVKNGCLAKGMSEKQFEESFKLTVGAQLDEVIEKSIDVTETILKSEYHQKIIRKDNANRAKTYYNISVLVQQPKECFDLVYKELKDKWKEIRKLEKSMSPEELEKLQLKRIHRYE